MRRNTRLPELLAPAGDFEALIAAVKAGADAIYIGGKSFSARAFAKNFDLDEISLAVKYTHLHGVRLYVTINTLVYDKELPLAIEYAGELYKRGVDAIIAADVGLIRAIRKYVPSLEIHASTQMGIHNSYGANEAAELGCERVVLAREVSLEDINSITDRCRPTTEIFLHGALCVCHSGQCLFSSMVGGRSGNRGECAQPCRLPYNEKYPLSLKDLSLAEHIPALISSGVASLKIEGRMKSPGYVYRVTKIYRRLLDEGRSATEAEVRELEEIFSRGGFTDGYFTGRLSSGMTGVRSEEDKELSRGLEEISFTPMRKAVKASAKMVLGEPAELTLTLADRSVTVNGPSPVMAISSPLTEQSVKERLMKLGDTYLSLAEEDISLALDEGINLPPSAINALRRAAAEALLSCEREFTPKKYEPKGRGVTKPTVTAEVNNLDLARKLIKEEGLSLDLLSVPLESLDKGVRDARGISCAIPAIVMENELTQVEKMLSEAKKQGIMYATVDNIGHFALARKYGFKIFGGARLNTLNRESAALYRELGAEVLLLSHELTLSQARDIGGGVTVYGRIPLMITERCFIKENFGCDKCASAELCDRTGASFPMARTFCHRNIIYNSVTTFMLDKLDELSAAGLNHRHIIISTESAAVAADRLDLARTGSVVPPGMKIRRMGAQNRMNTGTADERDAGGKKGKNKAKALDKAAKPTTRKGQAGPKERYGRFGNARAVGRKGKGR